MVKFEMKSDYTPWKCVLRDLAEQTSKDMNNRKYCWKSITQHHRGIITPLSQHRCVSLSLIAEWFRQQLVACLDLRWK